MKKLFYAAKAEELFNETSAVKTPQRRGHTLYDTS
jgi:hypothetical protein